MYCDLQNCTDVLEAVPDLCTGMFVTASDDGNKVTKVEEGSYVLEEEEDPLAVTLPATKAEEEVSNVQQTSYSLALLGRSWCRKYPVRVCGLIRAVVMEVFDIFLSASETVVRYYLSVTEQLLTPFKLWLRLTVQKCTDIRVTFYRISNHSSNVISDLRKDYYLHYLAL